MSRSHINTSVILSYTQTQCIMSFASTENINENKFVYLSKNLTAVNICVDATTYIYDTIIESINNIA